MGRETELKLDLAPRHWTKLRSHPLLAGRRPTVERQFSVYFDTAKGKLRRHGWTLRIRRSGARFVQTIKQVGGGAGLFDRNEWEAAVADTAPDADAAATTPLSDLIEPGQFGKLVPVFRTDIQRSTWTAQHQGATIEVVADRGRIEAGGAVQPVEEIELELKEGDVAALFDLASRLNEAVPVRLGVLSKAERGFAVADGRSAAVSKAAPVALSGSASLADAFATIVAACLRHFRMNEPLLLADRNPEALHQARVALRRLRSALSLFRPAIRDERFASFRDALRSLTHRMGEARNIDVLLGNLPADDSRVRRLERERLQYYAAIERTLESRRFRQLMLDISGWAHAGSWRRGRRASAPLLSFAARRLDRLWADIEGRGQRPGLLSEKGRHRLRIDAKKIRYALEFLHDPLESAGTRQRKFARSAEGLQEVLGRLNDLATARLLDPAPNGSGDAAADEEEARLLRATERYLRQLRKVGSYWRDLPRGGSANR